MIAKMDDDDAVIERLIQEELDALDENNLDSDHDSDEDNTVEDSDEVEEQEKDVDVQFDSSIEDYLSTIKCYNEKAAKRLDETEQVMHELEKVNLNTDELLKEKLCQILDDPNGDSVLAMSKEVLLHLEGLDHKETENMTEEENNVPSSEGKDTIDEIEEIKEIEDKAQIELNQLCLEHRLVEENIRLFEERKKKENKRFDELMRDKRQAKMKELESLQISFKKNNEELTNTLQGTLNLEVTHMKKFEDDMKEKLDVLDADYVTEKERLLSFQDEMTKLTDEKLNNSALTIQKHYKRHRVQQRYATEIIIIKEKTFQRHETKINEKVREKERIKSDIERKHREELLKEENERKERERLEKEKEERRRKYEEQKSLIAKQHDEMKSQESARSVRHANSVDDQRSSPIVSVGGSTSDAVEMKLENHTRSGSSTHDTLQSDLQSGNKNELSKKEHKTDLKKNEILDLCSQLDDTTLNSAAHMNNSEDQVVVDTTSTIRTANCEQSQHKDSCDPFQEIQQIHSPNSDKKNKSGPDFIHTSLTRGEKQTTFKTENSRENKKSIVIETESTVGNISSKNERDISSDNGLLKEEGRVLSEKEDTADEGFVESNVHVYTEDSTTKPVDETSKTEPTSKSEHSINLVHTDSGFSSSDEPKVNGGKPELKEYSVPKQQPGSEFARSCKFEVDNGESEGRRTELELSITKESSDVPVNGSPTDRSACSCFQLDLTEDGSQSLSQLYKDWLSQNEMEGSRDRKPIKGRPGRKRRFFGKIDSIPLTIEQIRDGCCETKEIEKVQVVSLENIEQAISCSPLSQCTRVECLNLSQCHVEVFDGVEGCGELKSLVITHCNLSNLDMKFDHLSFLNLSNNSLSGIHGLEMLPSLIHLDLSHNSILRINGFEQCHSLLYLNLDDNQVISTRGMEHLSRLIYFTCANNNVSFFEEVKKLPFLQVLNLSGNTLAKVPPLVNNILLRELNLDNNIITKLDNLKDYWLPQLNTVSIIGNCLQELADVSHLLSLRHFIVENNLLSTVESFEVLQTCHNLNNLKVFGNSVATVDNYRILLKEMLPQLQEIDGDDLEENKVGNDGGKCSCLEGICESQNTKYVQLSQQIDTNWSFNRGESVESILENLNLQRIYWEQLYEESIKQLSEHKSLFQEETDNTETKVGCAEKLNADSETDIQSLSKPVLNQPSSHITTVGTSVNNADPSPEHQEICAIKIQAIYRGYHGRKLFDALKHASSRNQSVPSANHPRLAPPHIADDNDGDSDFAYDEVDLEEFNMADEDMEWLVPDTPQLPARGPPLPNISPSADNKVEGRDAWRSPTTNSPPTKMTPGRSTSSSYLSERNISSLATSRCSKGLSKKAEILSDEWGFQSEATAELMLKRAKKLGKTKKKKSSSTDRYELFKKSEVASHMSTASPTRKKNPPERISYFKATSPVPVDQNQHTNNREMTYRWVCNQPVFHADRATEVMSRNADYYTEADKPTTTTMHKIPRNGSEPLVLPQIDPSVIAGRPLSLVQSEIHNPKPPLTNRSTSGSGKARRRLHASQHKSHSAPNPDKRTDLCVTNSDLDGKWKSYAYR